MFLFKFSVLIALLSTALGWDESNPTELIAPSFGSLLTAVSQLPNYRKSPYLIVICTYVSGAKHYVRTLDDSAAPSYVPTIAPTTRGPTPSPSFYPTSTAYLTVYFQFYFENTCVTPLWLSGVNVGSCISDKNAFINNNPSDPNTNSFLISGTSMHFFYS